LKKQSIVLKNFLAQFESFEIQFCLCYCSIRCERRSTFAFYQFVSGCTLRVISHLRASATLLVFNIVIPPAYKRVAFVEPRVQDDELHPSHRITNQIGRALQICGTVAYLEA
jgi:hypothetical protein